MIAEEGQPSRLFATGSTFNVRLQSAIRCIPTCKGRRQTGVDEIQQLDHWWFCRGRRTKRGRVPSSRHGGRVREGGRVRACSGFLLELDAREKARGESGSVPASQEGAAARASRRTRVPQRADCAAHLSLSGSARDCAAIAKCAAHGGGSGGAKVRCCRRLIEIGRGARACRERYRLDEVCVLLRNHFYFSDPRKTAEQLTALERWYRILSEALKKFLRRRKLVPPRQLPAGAASYG